ncbi:HAD family hydrolase [Epilithonimonas pallida]|uniref:Hydrolase of the HAD superfamily n=1 Tax=Epilithonimonas pallida TaxID=373671 RepID=A0ABY1R7G5_9FLAO|nr:HAD family hydrolase [Epilithonimonas pallida]SMP94831.1 putative hydrolase of the HAD superfamily [Epilithonimonas pallida]
MNKYIVFDLDDTLFYEVDFLKSAYKEIAKKLVPDDNYISLYNEMLELYYKQQDVFGILASKFHSSKEVLLTLYREHFPDINLRDGVKDILNKLKDENIKMGLLTDGRSVTQRNKIKALDIENYFDKIIISEEFGSEKPDKKNYNVFLEPGYEFFYIADNPKKDFITPNLLGWKTIMIEDNEGKKIHAIPNILQEKYNAEKTVSWQYFYALIE